MASKLWVHEPDTFFLFEDTEISEKWNFFVNHSKIARKFSTGKIFGASTQESLGTQDSENVYERSIQQIFDPVSVGRSWMSALAKL